MALQVPENRPATFGKTPANFAGPSRVIFKVTGGRTFGPKAYLVDKLSGDVLKVCIGIICLDAVWKKDPPEKVRYRTKCLRAPASLRL